MNLTRAYSQLHRALVDAARTEHLTPTDVRLLVAIHERGGQARTDELAADLCCEGTAVRRSVGALRGFWLKASAEGGGKTRPGVQTVLTLTTAGRRLVERVAEEVA
jgi:hypothetical protein